MAISAVLYDLAVDKKMGWGAGIARFLLWKLSLFYGFVVSILIWFYRLKPVHLGCKVISVGNITLGGTGKTVMVELIANYLKKFGHKPAILSRGYMKAQSEKRKAQNSFEYMGDEPFMLLEKLQDVPVLVDADRIRCAKTAIAEYNADTVLLDDGFQQWRIKKDLEILMINGDNPFGNRWLIPRGILRQPLYTLKNVDVFVLTNTFNADLNKIRKFLALINPNGLILEAEHTAKGIFCLSRKGELLEQDFFKGQIVGLFCGLGNPDSFRNLAVKISLKEGMFFEFPDHYRYTEEDLEKMFKESGEKNIRFLVTTEKDAVRIPLIARKRFGENIFVLAVELKIKNEEQGFINRLLRVYSA